MREGDYARCPFSIAMFIGTSILFTHLGKYSTKNNEKQITSDKQVKVKPNNVLIEGIYWCDAASNEMSSSSTGQLIKGVGLQGDRYARRIGTYSALPEPGRQLTIISADGVEEALQKQKGGMALPDIKTLRRNLSIRGISAQDLLNSIGSVLQLGSCDEDGGDGGAKVYVHRNTVPCMYNEKRNKLPGMMNALWDTGGVSCEVIESGTISVGDKVTILPPDISGCRRSPSNGGKPKAFFVKPKDRTGDMVRSLVEDKKNTKEKLINTDKEGLLRLQRSYESVGLQY